MRTALGPDRARYTVAAEGEERPVVNEIEEYWSGRYLSAGEAVWRIMGFQVTHKERCSRQVRGGKTLYIYQSSEMTL